MTKNRHTMGQDWGGRRKSNPDNCPKITKKMVYDLASELGIEIRRGDYFHDLSFYHSDRGTWWIYNIEFKWVTMGDTNYWAYCNLLKIKEKQIKKVLL